MIVTSELKYEIEKLKVNDYSSYTAFYDMTVSYLYKMIFSITGVKEDSDVVVKSVYQRIYQEINTLQDVNGFYNWAGYIATDEVFKYFNVNNRIMFDVLPQDIGVFEYALASEDGEKFIPENVLIDNEKIKIIESMINEFPTICKIILQYFYYDGISVSQIAMRLGCEESYVKICIQYIKNNLKDVINSMSFKQDESLHSLSQIPVFWIVFERSLGNVESGAIGATGLATAGNIGVGETGSGLAGTGASTNAGIGVVGGNSGGAVVAGSGSAGATATGSSTATIGTSGGTAAGTTIGTVGGTVASTAAGATAVATATGLGIGVKIAIGTAICATLIGGGLGINHIIQESNSQTEEMTDEIETIEEVTEATSLDVTEEITTSVAEETTEATTESASDGMPQGLDSPTELDILGELLPETTGWEEEDWINYATSFYDGTNPLFDDLDREYSGAYGVWQNYKNLPILLSVDWETTSSDGMHGLVIDYNSVEDVSRDFYTVFSRKTEPYFSNLLLEENGMLYIENAYGSGGGYGFVGSNGITRIESVDIENQEIIFIEECEYYVDYEDTSLGTEVIEYEFSLVFEDGTWKVNKIVDSY